MISKNQRISKNQISWLLKKSRKASDDFFSIKFQLNKKDFSRYSIVISKKVLRLATARNKLRRQCYEIVRQLNQPSKSIDLVIFLRPAATKLTYQELKKQLTTSINKINFP